MLNNGPVLNLQPEAGGHYFPTKFIFLQNGLRTVLGKQDSSEPSTTTAVTTRPRSASSTNGWFPFAIGHNLEPEHAEVWLENGKCFIRGLSPRGDTFVNGDRVANPIALQEGDVIGLGSSKEGKFALACRVTLIGF